MVDTEAMTHRDENVTIIFVFVTTSIIYLNTRFTLCYFFFLREDKMFPLLPNREGALFAFPPFKTSGDLHSHREGLPLKSKPSFSCSSVTCKVRTQPSFVRNNLSSSFLCFMFGSLLCRARYESRCCLGLCCFQVSVSLALILMF